MCAERTDNDRVAEPVDNLVSSPNAYGALGLIYAALAVPAALFPHTVRPNCLLGWFFTNISGSHYCLQMSAGSRKTYYWTL